MDTNIISTLKLKAREAKQVHDAYRAAQNLARNAAIQSQCGTSFPSTLPVEDRIDIVLTTPSLLQKALASFEDYKTAARSSGAFSTLVKSGVLTLEQVAAINPLSAQIAERKLKIAHNKLVA